MRRRFALALAAIAVVVASATSAPPMAAAASPLALPATVRVNVAGLGLSRALISTASTLTVTGPDGRTLYTGRGQALARLGVRRGTVSGAAIPQRGTVREELESLRTAIREARLEASGLSVAEVTTVPFELGVLEGDADGTGPPLVAAKAVVGVRFEADAGYLALNGRLFRGALELARDDEGDMIVVNTVATADYLASVVGAEVPASWEPAALAAQAIAARTYLLTHLDRHDAYDLEGDTRDQAYDGLESEAAATIEAVRRTAGIVAPYRGAAISALYSANAGGVTEDSENVFPNALPYLRSVPSPGDEVARLSDWGRSGLDWTRELTPKQLQAYLAARGIDVGEPRTIELLQKTAAGRVVRARVTGSTGSRDIGKDLSRYYFGLKSGLFTVVRRPTADIELVARWEQARLRELDALGATLIGPLSEPVPGSDMEPIEFVVVAYLYRVPDRFVFTGRGFGHGVGMSQWGAQGMALAGASYEQILAHYYRGIALTQVGGG